MCCVSHTQWVVCTLEMMPLWPTLHCISIRHTKAYRFCFLPKHVLVSLSVTSVRRKDKKILPLCSVSHFLFIIKVSQRTPCTALPYFHIHPQRKPFYALFCLEKSLHFFLINGVFLSPQSWIVLQFRKWSDASTFTTIYQTVILHYHFILVSHPRYFLCTKVQIL